MTQNISLKEALEKLLEAGRAQQAAKKAKKKSPNPYKDTIAVPNGSNGFHIQTVDRRLSDPHWQTISRIILVRRIHCTGCQKDYEAPNEHMMLRKEHPKHGILEEAIGAHDSKYDNLPTKVEIHSCEVPVCHNCVTDTRRSLEIINIVFHQELATPEPSPSDQIIEEPLEEGELGWEDPDNLAALEGL